MEPQKGPRIAKVIFKKKKAWDITSQPIDNFTKFQQTKEYGKDIKINGTKANSEINPHIYGQLIFNKRGKKIKQRK